MSFLLEHGGSLLVGATALLVAGCLLVACSRQPVHRQRMGETVALALLAWLLLAPWPLPRVVSRAPSPRIPTAVSMDVPPPPALERPVLRTPRVAPRSRAPLGVQQTRPAAMPRTPSVEQSAPVAWAELLAWTWIVGAGLTVLWLLVGWLRMRRIVKGSSPAPDWLIELAAAPRRVRVRVAGGSVRPLCSGVLRPVVLLPRELCAPRHTPLLRHVLRHELAHVRRGDCRTQWLFALLLPALFFHPLLWWLRRQVRQAAEVVADEVAASQSDRAAYARELIALAEQEVPRARALGGVAVFRNGSEFYRRMEMLLRRESPLSVACSRSRCLLHIGMAGLLLGVGAGLWGAPLPAQDPTRTDIEELRAERDRLAREVEELRAKVRGARTGVYMQSFPKSDYSVVEVEAGEGQTLRQILGQFYKDVNDPLIERVRELNPSLDEGRLRPGQKIDLPLGKSTVGYDAYTVPGSSMYPQGATDPGRAFVTYTVRKGDTLYGILNRYSGTYSDSLMQRFRQLNPALDADRMRPGQRIKVPSIAKARGNDYQVPAIQDPLVAERPVLQEPVAAEQPVLQDTYLRDPDVEAGRKPVADPYAHRPAPSLQGLALEPVLELVTRVVELRGEVEIAIARLEELHEQGKSTRIAQLQVQTAERKLEVVHRLIQGERDAAAMELDLVRKQLEGLGESNPQRMHLMVHAQRLELRISTLQSAF